MRFGRFAMIVLVLGVVLTACGGDRTWKPRPPAPQPPTQVIGGLPVATMLENLPDLTEAEVAYLVNEVEKEMEGLRVRRVVHSRTHPLERRYVELQFEYHETHARIRRSRSVIVDWDERREGRDGRGTWIRQAAQRTPKAEVCAPGRSFLDEEAVPETEVVQVYVSGDLTADEIIEVVDAAYNDVPEGEKLSSIRRADDGGFEVMTVKVSKYRSLSGSVLEVRRFLGRWTVARTGMWVS